MGQTEMEIAAIKIVFKKVPQHQSEKLLFFKII